MTRMVDVARELEEDHRRIMDEFLNIGDSIEVEDIARAEKILSGLEELICSHFRFEEEALYPSLRRLLGLKMDLLMQEHDEVINATRTLAELLSNGELSREERIENAWWQIRFGYSHIKNCACSATLVKRLDEEELSQLEVRLLDARKAKVHLFEWVEWRRGRAAYAPYLDSR